VARRKKKGASTLGIDLSVPDCLKPLIDNKGIMTYIITRCTEGTSDKVYIFIVATHKKKMYLARFWGAFAGAMSGMHEDYNKDAFQKLINEKALKGYKIVDNTEITESSDVYETIAKGISDYVDQLSKFKAGSKVPLN